MGSISVSWASLGVKMPWVECGRSALAYASHFPMPALACEPLEGVQIDEFILQGSPQPLDHAVVDPTAFSIHADLDLRIR